MTKYISPADTAKLVRKALKEAFPNQTFYVRSSTYAGGASIDVKWLDGPTEPEVDQVVQVFSGKSFDGSIDMGCYWRHWVLPDGTIELASGPGTEGSMGYIPSADNAKPHPEAEKVSFGADYVFANRYTSKELVEKVGEVVQSEIGYECKTRSWSYPITKSTTWVVGGFDSRFDELRPNWVNKDYRAALHWTSVVSGGVVDLRSLFDYWESALRDAGVEYGEPFSVEPLIEDTPKKFPEVSQREARRLLDLFFTKRLGWSPKEVSSEKVNA